MSATQVQNSAQTNLISTFQIAGRQCGIDAMKVQEVVRVSEITPVHHAPKRIIGVINLRGKIVTVIDLGAVLEMGYVKINPESRIFIVEWNGEYVGLLAETAGDVLSVNPEEITTPPANLHGAQGHYFLGVYPTGNKLVAILNTMAVLSEDDSEHK